MIELNFGWFKDRENKETTSTTKNKKRYYKRNKKNSRFKIRGI